MSDIDTSPEKRTEIRASADVTQRDAGSAPPAQGAAPSASDLDAALQALNWAPPPESDHSFLRRLFTWPGRWVRRQAIRAVGANLWEQRQHELNLLRAKLEELSSLKSVRVKDLAELQTRFNEQIFEWVEREHERINILWGSADRMHGMLRDEIEMTQRLFPFFEESRGEEERIRAQQTLYLPEFQGKRRVIDLGCGRGEFLEMLKGAGIGAEGVEAEGQFSEAWEQKGLTVHQRDMFEWLSEQPDASVDGVFCAQVVEHFPTSTVDGLVAQMARVLEPDGRLVLETLNPTSLNIFMGPQWADPTHRKPIHPWTLSILCQTRGLMENRIVYSAPPPKESLLPLLETDGLSGEVRPTAERLNTVISQLNDALYGPAHFAVISRRGRPDELRIQ